MLRCRECQHHRTSGEFGQIGCANPPNEMCCGKHATEQGWFHFPLMFDPIWGMSNCPNFTEGEGGAPMNFVDNTVALLWIADYRTEENDVSDDNQEAPDNTD